MANPTVTFNGSVNGAWFTPITDGAVVTSAKVFINASSIPVTRPISAQVYEVPSRAAKVVQLGKAHREEGSVDGKLVAASVDGVSLTADDLLARLNTLIENQEKYDTIELVSYHFKFENVVLHSGYSISPYLGATKLYDISVPFISLKV